MGTTLLVPCWAPATPAGRPVTVEARPRPAAAVLQLVAAALLAVLALLVLDGLGRVIAVPLVVGLTASGLRDLLLVPTLHATPEQLDVVDGVSRSTLAWSEVERLRVVTDRRAPLLEVDLGHQVVVLSRRRLGRDPRVVLEELRALVPDELPEQLGQDRSAYGDDPDHQRSDEGDTAALDE